jgi:hypothetical protein
MASQIDPTVFPDNTAVDKASLRNQFQIAKDEITALQGGTPSTLTALQSLVTELQARVTALENP